MADKKAPMTLDEIFDQFEFGLARLRELFVVSRHQVRIFDAKEDKVTEQICVEAEKILEAVGESLVTCFQQVDENFRRMNGIIERIDD